MNEEKHVPNHREGIEILSDERTEYVYFPLITNAAMPNMADLIPASYAPDVSWSWRNGLGRIYSFAPGYSTWYIQMDTPYASQCVGIQFWRDSQLKWEGIPEGVGHWSKKAPYGDATHWRTYFLKRDWFTQRIMAGDDVWTPNKYRALCTPWP